MNSPARIRLTAACAIVFLLSHLEVGVPGLAGAEGGAQNDRNGTAPASFGPGPVGIARKSGTRLSWVDVGTPQVPRPRIVN